MLSGMSTWSFLPLILLVGCLLLLARAFRHRLPPSSRDDGSYAMTGSDAHLYTSTDSSGSSDSNGDCSADGSGDAGGGDCGDGGGGGDGGSGDCGGGGGD
jgi:hypothetical protein